MGFFSWLDCKTNKSIRIGSHDSYLLIPEQFGGGHYHESYYRGYGMFGSHDVYEEVAKWNRKNLSADMIEAPDRSRWADDEEGQQWYELAVDRYMVRRKRITDYAAGVDDRTMRLLYGADYLRNIGIDIACYDEQNAALPFPIKITHDKNAEYEDYGPSKSDPNQGL